MTINTINNELPFKVESENVQYSQTHILSKYKYHTNKVFRTSDKLIVKPQTTTFQFKTELKVPKLGVMIVGWGGNNGSTLTASIIANKNNIKWNTKEGLKSSNYYGSVVMASTIKLGMDDSGNEYHHKFSDILPMANPNNFVIGGWDINRANLKQAMQRAKVLDYDLQKQLYDQMEKLQPLPSIYDADFIALNQEDRANNLIKGNKQQQLEQIMSDINNFKQNNKLDKVIVVWSANTERFSELIDGVNDTADNIIEAIKADHKEISPSTMFAIASILTKTPFVNGSPQNTFVPGVIQLANLNKVFIGGDDFKSGQTKLKSVMVDFLVNAGIKPVAITSYNHLGNNDGKNLSAPQQFRSKEISKSSVVDDMVAANHLLYKKGEHPDHTVVIKYVPSVGDSKRALDEYVSEIFMGGTNTISVYNICEDSLLASPLIIDLVLVTELMTRVEFKTEEMAKYQSFNAVLSILSYMLKAPLVYPGTPVINSLYKQRSAMQNIFRAFVGLQPENDMLLEHKAF